MSNKWLIKNRDFELENVKYLAKMTQITREEDPLVVEGEIKIPVKKKFVKSKISLNI
jgi:hypothetical protein